MSTVQQASESSEQFCWHCTPLAQGSLHTSSVRPALAASLGSELKIAILCNGVVLGFAQISLSELVSPTSLVC